MCYETDFLPADKHKNFLQIDTITLGMHGQACPKHPKQQLYNIFAISQGKHNGWSWFSPADNCQTFLKSDTVIFDVRGQTCPNTQNKKFAISLQYLKKEVNDKVDFLHAGTYENLLKLILWFWWRWSSISKVPKIASLQCLYNISKEEVRDEVDFLHGNKHQCGRQVDFNTLGTKFGLIIDKHDKAFSNYSQQQLCKSLQCFKKVRNRLLMNKLLLCSIVM